MVTDQGRLWNLTAPAVDMKDTETQEAESAMALPLSISAYEIIPVFLCFLPEHFDPLKQ